MAFKRSHHYTSISNQLISLKSMTLSASVMVVMPPLLADIAPMRTTWANHMVTAMCFFSSEAAFWTTLYIDILRDREIFFLFG